MIAVDEDCIVEVEVVDVGNGREFYCCGGRICGGDNSGGSGSSLRTY